MQSKSRNILQQRADEDRRARVEAARQRREYVRAVAARVRLQPLKYRPFEKIFGGEK